MYIFISHSSSDAGLAQELTNQLEEKGHSCFLAFRDIKGGAVYAEELIDAIDRSDAVLLLLSQKADKSPHVLREVERACSKKVPIVVVKLEEFELSKSMEYFVMMHQWVELEKNGITELTEAFEKIEAEKQTRTEAKEETETKTTTPELIERKRGRGKKQINTRQLLGGLTAACVLLAAGLLLWFGGQKNGEKKAEKRFAAKLTQAAGAKEAPTPVLSEAEKKRQELLQTKVGGTVQLGNYLGEAIDWRVLRINDDGSRVLISKNIICMKAFDAAESGQYDEWDGTDYFRTKAEEMDISLQRKTRGSNLWATSNLRTWLNSDGEVVTYADFPPKSSAMSERKNGYDTESGFLFGFSDEEKQLLIACTHTETDYETGEKVSSEDYVFLLSEEELSWLDEAGMPRYAKPGEAAVKNDKSKWYQNYALDIGEENLSWYLRDGESGYGNRCKLVGMSSDSGKLQYANAASEGYGVRPCICVK